MLEREESVVYQGGYIAVRILREHPEDPARIPQFIVPRSSVPGFIKLIFHKSSVH
jgi:hypothetical protein